MTIPFASSGLQSNSHNHTVNLQISDEVTAGELIPITSNAVHNALPLKAYGAFHLGGASYTIPNGASGTHDIPLVARVDVTPVGMSVNAGVITLTNAGTYLIMSTVYFLGDDNTFVTTLIRDTASPENNLFHMGIFGSPTVTNDDEVDRFSSNGHYVLEATAGYQFKLSANARFANGSTEASFLGTGLTVLQIT